MSEQGPDGNVHKVYAVEARTGSDADDDDDGAVVVGALWLGSTDQWQSAYIYDIRIAGEFQGSGFGRATLGEAERVASRLGAESLALHVFGDNTRARKLYLTSGYEETNVNMRKRLTVDTPDS
ncbi:MAG: GNAT family N-acetyltransferase [Thermoleophilia bacterium]|nr:GNAT family N-acetyltransferase [Thermoleophilia bacterium]